VLYSLLLTGGNAFSTAIITTGKTVPTNTTFTARDTTACWFLDA